MGCASAGAEKILEEQVDQEAIDPTKIVEAWERPKDEELVGNYAACHDCFRFPSDAKSINGERRWLHCYKRRA